MNAVQEWVDVQDCEYCAAVTAKAGLTHKSDLRADATLGDLIKDEVY